MPDQNALYPIREISRLTGVTPITLRAWERRYDLIEPVRTESGHRLYTQEHVDFINQAVALTKQGIPISKVKSVIEKQAETQTNAFHFANIDFEYEILQACYQCHSEKIQILIDQLCITLLDKQVRQIMVNITLKLIQCNASIQTLWHSILMPLLCNRTYHGRKLLPNGRKKNAYILCASQYQPVLEQLVAHQCILSGYNPIIGWGNEAEELLDKMQNLHCEALIVIDSGNHSSTIEGWSIWAKNHKSIELFYITESIDEVQGMDLINLKPCTFMCDLN